MFKNVFWTGGQRVDRQRREQKLNENRRIRRKITKDSEMYYGLLRNRGGTGLTEGQDWILWRGTEEERAIGTEAEKKKGSDLEEADREKMTVPREGERLFSGAHWSCGEVIKAKKETDRKTEEQTRRQTGWSLSSFSPVPLSLSLCVFICTPLWTRFSGTLGRLQGMGLNFNQRRLS